MPQRIRKTRSLSPSPAQRAKNLLFGHRKRSPERGLKGRTISDDKKDHARLNILGTDSIVTTDTVLDSLLLAMEQQSFTKLELEDIINRKTDRKTIYPALLELLQQDGGRQWEYVKFVDYMRVHPSSDEGPSRVTRQLCDYEDSQQHLWALMKGIAHDNKHKECKKPVSFQLTMEVDEGTGIDCLIKLMRLLLKSNLQGVEFGGALYGSSIDDIPKKLAGLFKKEEEEDEFVVLGLDPKTLQKTMHVPDAEKRNLCLEDRIMMNLIYAPPHIAFQEPNGLVSECLQTLKDLRAEWNHPNPKRSGNRRNCVANIHLKVPKKKASHGSVRTPKKPGHEEPKKKLRRKTISVEGCVENLKELLKDSPHFQLDT